MLSESPDFTQQKKEKEKKKKKRDLSTSTCPDIISYVRALQQAADSRQLGRRGIDDRDCSGPKAKSISSSFFAGWQPESLPRFSHHPTTSYLQHRPMSSDTSQQPTFRVFSYVLHVSSRAGHCTQSRLHAQTPLCKLFKRPVSVRLDFPDSTHCTNK